MNALNYSIYTIYQHGRQEVFDHRISINAGHVDISSQGNRTGVHLCTRCFARAGM